MARYIDAETFEQHMQSEWEKGEICTGTWIRFREMLNDESTADVREKVNGAWIDEEYDIGECYATCSVCGEISQGKAEDNGFGYDYSFSKYCPNCGARMEAGE